MSEPPGDITRLLQKWNAGDEQARDQVVTSVYMQLRRIARRRMQAEPTGHTLQTTALIHEAYLRLMGQGSVSWKNRSQFFNVAARVMRRVLVDHARRRRAGKRGGGADVSLPLEAAVHALDRSGVDAIALNDALDALALIDPRQAQIVELKFFAGLTISEIGHDVGLSSASVKRQWETAKMWLRREMDDGR